MKVNDNLNRLFPKWAAAWRLMGPADRVGTVCIWGGFLCHTLLILVMAASVPASDYNTPRLVHVRVMPLLVALIGALIKLANLWKSSD